MRYKLLKHQDEFLYSNKVHTGLVGGFRSGKTFVGTLKTVAKKMQYPGINVAYYLPNYPLIRDVALPYFETILSNQQMDYSYNKQDKIFSTELGDIILRSMHQPEFIIGYEVGYSLVDEADILPMHKMDIAYKKILSRNSVKLPDGLPNSTDFVSTPEGFKFLYNFFEVNKNSSKSLINARTKDNPYISESYIKTLTDEYTEEELLAYLDGKFVNLTSGTVFRSFDRFEHDSFRIIKTNDVLHVGMDFNITKMSAVFHVQDRATSVVTAVDEITNAYDTSEMSRKIKERYPGHTIIIYPDASGASRKSTGYSDFDILKKEGFKIVSGKSNPSVKDRISKTNKGFESYKYLVNTEKCPKFTEGLEQLAYKNNEVDKSSGHDHVTDAATYCFYNIGKAFIDSGRTKKGYEVPFNRM